VIPFFFIKNFRASFFSNNSNATKPNEMESWTGTFREPT